jgi:hypothetical protein
VAELGVPLTRVLVTGLGWCNELQHCVYRRPTSIQARRAEVQRLLDLSRAFAEPLASIATKGDGMAKENQVLSEYHLFHGWVHRGAADAVASYEEAVAWNPNNHNAAELLKGRRFEASLDAVVGALNKDHTAAAGRALRELERHVTNDEEQAWALLLTAMIRLRRRDAGSGLGFGSTASAVSEAEDLLRQALDLNPPAGLREQIERAQSQLRGRP